MDINLDRVEDLREDANAVLHQADLEADPWPLNNHDYDIVIVTNYLWRPIMADIINCVAKRGYLIYQTFAIGNERYGKPSNPNYLLKPGELMHAVHDDLTCIGYAHGVVLNPKPAVMQHIIARRD